jgi:uncharacterized OB-fold protein
VTTLARPVPHPTSVSRPYWEACARHELTVQRCDDCSRYVFVPQPFCRYCLSPRLSWVPSTGRGTLYSYTIVWRPQTPAFPVPYVVGIVRLDEGYDMLSNVVECEPREVRTGMALELAWDDVEPGVSLPVFRPRTN